MKQLPARLVSILILLALAMAGAPLLAAEKVTLDCEVLEVVNSKKVIVAVRSGEFQGRWSLQFRTAPGAKEGQRGRIRAGRDVLESRKGPAKVGFKGTDEELQAIIDWLGSLE